MTALIDTSVVLVTTHWVRDCNGEKVPLHEERALAWRYENLTTADKCHLLALTIAHAEAAA